MRLAGAIGIMGGFLYFYQRSCRTSAFSSFSNPDPCPHQSWGHVLTTERKT